MVAKPSSDADHPLSPELIEQLKPAKVNKLVSTTAEVKAQLSEKEQDTLQYLRARHDGFWKRVGKYESLIRERAAMEMNDYTTDPTSGGTTFQGIQERMTDLNVNTKQRLSFFSRKTAERFAEITSRINVSSRTLSAIRKHRALISQTAASLKQGNDFLRKQVLIDHGRILTLPGLRSLFVPSNPDLNKSPEMDYEKLEQAARNVQTKAKTERGSWEKEIEGRFQGVRGVENKLREILLRHDPDSKEQLEKELQEYALGKSTALDTRIKALKIKGIDPGALKEIKSTLEKWLKLLKGKSGNLSKSFEVAGRLELTGSLPEVLSQMKSSLVGTHFKFEHSDMAPPAGELVLDAKHPSGCLVFRILGTDEYLAVDPGKKAAWKYKLEKVKTTSLKSAEEVAKSVREKAKELGITEDAILQKILTDTQEAMLKAGATSETVKEAVIAVLKASSLPVGFDKTSIDHIIELAKTQAERVLPSTPATNATEAANNIREKARSLGVTDPVELRKIFRVTLKAMSQVGITPEIVETAVAASLPSTLSGKADITAFAKNEATRLLPGRISSTLAKEAAKEVRKVSKTLGIVDESALRTIAEDTKDIMMQKGATPEKVKATVLATLKGLNIPGGLSKTSIEHITDVAEVEAKRLLPSTPFKTDADRHETEVDEVVFDRFEFNYAA